jgi:hypothetical protein
MLPGGGKLDTKGSNEAFVVLAAAAVLILVGVVFAATSAGEDGAATSSSAGRSISANEFTADALSALASTGGTEKIVAIAERSGVGFYEIEALKEGDSCYASGAVASTRDFAHIECGREPEGPRESLIDMSTIRLDPADPQRSIRFVAVQGIAADGVASVGVEGSDGSVSRTPVVDNVYVMDEGAIKDVPPAAIVAFDPAGTVVERRAFLPSA